MLTISATTTAHAFNNQKTRITKIVRNETHKNNSYSCKYYVRRGLYYGYETINNNIKFFEPVINNKEYIVSSKQSDENLGGQYSVLSYTQVSCHARCKILRITKYERNTFSLEGYLLPARKSFYKAMNGGTIYGESIDDLENGCMASAVKKEEKIAHLENIKKKNEAYKNKTIKNEHKAARTLMLNKDFNMIDNKGN